LRPGLRSEIDRGLLQGHCGIWLAQTGAAPAGFCFAESEEQASPRDAGGAGWIHELWVEPDWRRRGVGAALVRPALDFLARRASRISVRVEAANSDGLGFWSALGFRPRANVLELPARGLGSGDGTGTAR
jgi:GNAT superfamily N-acetyltransferase